jgi:alpha-1,3-rhamnosyl/mannosyltransferase
MNRMMPQVVKRADHILADSEFVRQEIIEYYGVTPERVTTVLLGVSSDFYPVREDACKVVLARHELRYGDYLLAVGTLEPRKNLSTVIAAFAQLPETTRRRFPLIIVGMKGWGMEEFSAATRQMFDRGEVRMLGYVPQADLPTLYAGARLFVYPSIYEGFGLPPLEAMACGTPVIVSNRASLPEVVGNAGILVDPMDDAIIAQQMSAVLENDGLYQKLSEAGVKQAKSFTWRNCATGTMAVYQKVLECH